MAKGIPQNAPLIHKAEKALSSWMCAVKAHYIPQNKPIPVPYCTLSILKHIQSRECCTYAISAARSLHYLQLAGDLHANRQLYRHTPVHNCNRCQKQKQFELQQNRNNNHQAWHDTATQHVEDTSCSLHNSLLSSEGGVIYPSRSRSVSHPHQSKKVRRKALQKAKKKGGTSICRDSNANMQNRFGVQKNQAMKNPAKRETIIFEVEEIGKYAYLVQETWLEGDFVQKLKHGQTFIHHDPVMQESRRGSGGVRIILSEKATADWKREGGEVVKGGALGGMTTCMALWFDTIKSSSNSVPKFIICNAYFLNSKKEDSPYELMCDKVAEFIAGKDFVIIGADTQASIDTRKSRNKNSEAEPDYCLGPYGSEWKNLRAPQRLHIVFQTQAPQYVDQSSSK
jgi:hypothetical protein